MRRNLLLILLCLLSVSCSKWFSSASDTLVTPALAGARLPRLSAMPHLSTSSQQGALMSWVEPFNNGHVLKFGINENGKWVRSGEVTRGENWFINWADMPSVVAIDDHFWVAHWLVKQGGGKSYDYDVWVAVSNDAGRTWSQPAIPHKDGAAAEHGFLSFFKDGDGAGAIWLDGRDYVDAKDRTKFPEKSGNFSLRYTHINRDGSFGDEQVIDNNVCTCCQTAVAATPIGALAAWRGHTDDEIRDNRVSLLRDGKWSTYKPLGAEGWQIDGCPVNGPTVAARGMNVVAVWFTAQGDKPRVRAAFSIDGGITFGAPIEIDDSAPLGRVGVAWQNNKTAMVTWMMAADSASKQSSLAMRLVSMDDKSNAIKELGNLKQVAQLNSGRDTGVPQISATERGVMLAWTAAPPSYGIKTMFFTWEDFSKAEFVNKSYMEQSSSVMRQLFATKPVSFIASLCTNPH